MFFAQPKDWKHEVVVNLLGSRSYGRGRFIQERFGLSPSEVWGIRRRIDVALEPLASGRPRVSRGTDSTHPRAEREEKEAEHVALETAHAAEVEQGRRRLAVQAAVLPCSMASIALLEKAALGTARGHETIRTQVQAACRKAEQILDAIPWEEHIDRLAADELFAGKTPILVCVEPESMAVPVVQRGPDRTAKTWEEVLGRFPLLEVVSSDQGKGILGAVRSLGLLSQADAFHAFQDLKQCVRSLELQAYKRIAKEYEAKKACAQPGLTKTARKRLERRHDKARATALQAMERYDRAAQAVPLIKGSIALFDESGRYLSYAESKQDIEEAIAILQEVKAPHRKKVARACAAERLLNFKAMLEMAIEYTDDFPEELSTEELIDVAVATQRPCPSERPGMLRWVLLRAMDHKLTAECPTWPLYRSHILRETALPFRSSSWVESTNSRLRVDQQVLKHLKGILTLWALAHNATPFHSGERAGKSPLEILGIQMPPGTWIDWVLAE